MRFWRRRNRTIRERFFERDGQPQTRQPESIPTPAPTPATPTVDNDELTATLEKSYEAAICGWRRLINYNQSAGRSWVLDDFHCDKDGSLDKKDALVELLNVPDLFLLGFFKIALSDQDKSDEIELGNYRMSDRPGLKSPL